MSYNTLNNRKIVYMKKKMSLFSIKYHEGLLHVWILFYRILLSAFMLTHGWPKLMRLLSQEEISFPDPLGLGVMVSLALAVFAEVICSLFVIAGIATRLAVIPQIITMVVAIFIVHAGHSFAKKEMALLYLIGYITLLILGSGKYSVDKYFRK